MEKEPSGCTTWGVRSQSVPRSQEPQELASRRFWFCPWVRERNGRDQEGQAGSFPGSGGRR